MTARHQRRFNAGCYFSGPCDRVSHLPLLNSAHMPSASYHGEFSFPGQIGCGRLTCMALIVNCRNDDFETKRLQKKEDLMTSPLIA
jgi:hypothetical protein